jgi:hypothetical protein
MKDDIIAILILACIIMSGAVMYLVLDRAEKRITIKSQKDQILEMSRMMPPEQDRKWSTKQSILNSVEDK